MKVNSPYGVADINVTLLSVFYVSASATRFKTPNQVPPVYFLNPKVNVAYHHYYGLLRWPSIFCAGLASVRVLCSVWFLTGYGGP